MEDSELVMLMRSLLAKAQEEINTTNTWEAEAEEVPTFTAMLSSAGVSLHSFLSTTAAHDDPLDPKAMSSSSSLMPLPFSEFAQDTLITTTPTHSPTTTFNFTTAAEADYIQTQMQSPILRLPKHEPISNYQDYFPIPSPSNTNVCSSPSFHHLPQQQYQFYNNPPDLNLEFTMHSASSATSTPIHHHSPYDSMNDCSSIFHHLPDLLPLDPFNSPYSSSSYKRARLFDPPHFQNLHLSTPLPLFPPNNNTHNALLPSSSSSPYKIPAKPRTRKRGTPSPSPSPSPSPHASSLARGRRQKLSDKTRCLEKLLPLDRKMDTATVFEEAYKYVKFLQAQVTALQAMPVVTPNTSSASATGFDDDNLSPMSSRTTGGLERLSRNQLLQVLLNSPVAQTVMYSQGCCVFSVEQLAKFNCSRSSRSLNLLRHYYPHLFFDSHSPTN
ncbi:hypothetical protein PRUPE_3G222500 [Prunus persica]|uniref:BHLH domain-containing protein n=1 Tax=Prunus persica TaxID=3760 RepID=A0A251Q3Z8_PRUPE|nr:hypothetical protein PRUPE_3G222500 [Prunus persica]